MALESGVYRYVNRDVRIAGRNVTVLRRSYADPPFLPHDMHGNAGTGAPERSERENTQQMFKTSASAVDGFECGGNPRPQSSDVAESSARELRGGFRFLVTTSY